MSKERNIEILQYKINELEEKITHFINFNISPKKRIRLEVLKGKYESQLEEILNE